MVKNIDSVIEYKLAFGTVCMFRVCFYANLN